MEICSLLLLFSLSGGGDVTVIDPCKLFLCCCSSVLTVVALMEICSLLLLFSLSVCSCVVTVVSLCTSVLVLLLLFLSVVCSCVVTVVSLCTSVLVLLLLLVSLELFLWDFFLSLISQKNTGPFFCKMLFFFKCTFVQVAKWMWRSKAIVQQSTLAFVM